MREVLHCPKCGSDWAWYGRGGRRVHVVSDGCDKFGVEALNESRERGARAYAERSGTSDFGWSKRLW